uniref:1-(5-phosphoribosyl)-5-[(5-phosphoribosylamino)methylideneamino] imidazole-4-carboxamide isomerase n=1 Tax=Fervidicoccus fontis TaxID=683846 RepID=A0A7J3ZLI9_9CREN
MRALLVIPSIDISQGRVVKLVHGVKGTGIVLKQSPVEVAREWAARGARRIHVVDIDGAMLGRPVNHHVIKDIASNVKVPLQAGGGIRSVADCLNLACSGVQWIILGTKAVTSIDFLERVVSALGSSRIIVAIDSKRGRVAVNGWRSTLDIDPCRVARSLDDLGLDLHALLYTCVDVEGTLSGVCIKSVERLTTTTSIPLIYAGGVSSIEDIRLLKKLGVYGVVLGMALYTGRLRLEEAISVAEA